jgi:hypothetical protein
VASEPFSGSLFARANDSRQASQAGGLDRPGQRQSGFALFRANNLNHATTADEGRKEADRQVQSNHGQQAPHGEVHRRYFLARRQ